MSHLGELLNIASRALSAQQAALNTTGHNIANVNTEGYSRQRVIMEPSLPIDKVNFTLGTGVQVGLIERVRSEFIDHKLRDEMQMLSRWDTFETNLRQIEDSFGEPSESNLAAFLNQFFDSWQDLANEPDSKSARQHVKQLGVTLTNKFHNISSQLGYQKELIEEEIEQVISDVNDLADKIADLNEKIARLGRNGKSAADLGDKRDILLDKLSELVDVTVTEQSNGMINLSLGGKVFVEQRSVVHVSSLNRSTNSMATIELKWEDSEAGVNVNGGSLSALVELHNEIIPNYSSQLDSLALGLVEKVNEIHSSGYGLDGTTDVDFFNSTTTGASDIELAAAILNDYKTIAASNNDTTGNGDTALAIAQAQNALTMDSDSLTFSEYYRSLISSIADMAQDSIAVRESQEMIVQQLEFQRQSISGVSLDEEMANLIQFQRAYQAAAKLISIADEMAETLLQLV